MQRSDPLYDQRSLHHARVAQLDRALASGAKGHRFESCRVHFFTPAMIQSSVQWALTIGE